MTTKSYKAEKIDGSWVVRREDGLYLMGGHEWTMDPLLAKPFMNRGEALVEGLVNDGRPDFFEDDDV